MGQQHSIAPAEWCQRGRPKNIQKCANFRNRKWMKMARMSEDSSVPTEPELQCDQHAFNDPSPPAGGYYSRNISCYVLTVLLWQFLAMPMLVRTTSQDLLKCFSRWRSIVTRPTLDCGISKNKAFWHSWSLLQGLRHYKIPPDPWILQKYFKSNY